MTNANRIKIYSTRKERKELEPKKVLHYRQYGSKQIIRHIVLNELS